MECEEFILPDWSPPDNPIQSERASSSIMECEEFILPDWSPSDDPARVLAAEGRRNPSDNNNDDDKNNADGHGHQKVSVDGEWLCLKELQELGENDHHRHYHYYQRTLALLSINIGQTEYIPQSLPKIGQENTIIIIIITI